MNIKIALSDFQNEQLHSFIEEIKTADDSGKPKAIFAQIWVADPYNFMDVIMLDDDKAKKIQAIVGQKVGKLSGSGHLFKVLVPDGLIIKEVPE